ncbi:hypothetical protein PsorP6_003200 [Peronosclerospora sorghi]|uniref:Uncharacterized protein n=1 Tax=Peronosclerospora sorghi TaxID=230839 RepID=A0ACC0VJ34_9STRA|nr:hypothetical protein PsorP6_003200 [Peronosclerospora sorghi]
MMDASKRANFKVDSSSPRGVRHGAQGFVLRRCARYHHRTIQIVGRDRIIFYRWSTVGCPIESCRQVERERGMWQRGCLACAGVTNSPETSCKKCHVLNTKVGAAISLATKRVIICDSLKPIKEDPLRIQPSNNTQVRLDLKRVPLFDRTIWEPGSLHRNRQVRSLQVSGINKPLVSVIVAKNMCDRYLRCQMFAERRSLTGDCTRASVIELPEKHIGRVGVVVPRLPAEWVDDITKFAVLPDDSREVSPWATEEAGTLIVGTRHARLIKDVERR